MSHLDCIYIIYNWLQQPFQIYFYYNFMYLFIYSDDEEYSKWNSFVETIKSKLTVKQVVDGVRAGGALSFDYLLLIVTAE